MALSFQELGTSPGAPVSADSGLAAGHAAADAGVRFGDRSGLTTRLLSAREIADIEAAQWDALSADALVENPFYARTYVTAGLSTIDAKSRVSAFAVWSAEGKLVGFFPMRSLLGVGCGAHNIYQFSGAPLVHGGRADDVVLAWLEEIRAGRLPRCWRLPDLQLDGPLHDLIARSARRLGLSTAVTDSYSRPQLTRAAGGFEAHLAQALSKSRRKELERCLRRLREKGAVRFERATAPQAVRSALEAFLTLENAGWKGRAGTAFLAHGDDARFARAAFMAEGGGGGTLVDTLLLDDRPIAISINITSGSTLFTPKCAYSEPLRSFAPGLVLEYLVIERFYREAGFARMDAATTIDGHVVQGLWNETVRMGTLYVGSRAATARAAGFARAKGALKANAKLLRDRFRSAWRVRAGQRASAPAELGKHGLSRGPGGPDDFITGRLSALGRGGTNPRQVMQGDAK